MATIQDIEQAIRNADAAGDGEAVLQLAKARQQMLAQQAPQEAAPPRVPVVAQSDADLAVQRAAGQRSAKSMIAGIEEGGRLLKAGAEQVGAKAQDAWNFITKGTPFDYDMPVRDASGQLIKRDAGLLDSSKQLPQVANELIREQVQAQTDKDSGVNLRDRNVSSTMTQLGATTLAPDLLLPKATTLLGGMIKTTAGGSVGNAMMFDQNNNGLRNQAINAVAGPVIGGVTGMIPALKNAVGRALVRVSQGTRAGNAFDSAVEAIPSLAKNATLSQRTGVPELKTLERAVYNSDMVEHYAKQTDDFIDDAVTALKQPIKPNQNLADDFTAAQTKAEVALRNLRVNASNAYENGMNSAKDLASRVTKGGELAPVPTPGFTQALQKITNNVGSDAEYGLGSQLPDQFLQKLAQVSQGGGVKPADLVDVMKKLTRLQGDTGNPAGQALASQLRGALDGDLQKLQDMRSTPTMPQLDDSVQRILDVRQEYKRAQDAIRAVSGSAAYKLLGLGSADATADDALANLKAMTPEKRASVKSYLEKESPDLLVTLKQAAVEDMAKKAGTIRGAADSQQDLDSLLDGMFDAKNGHDLRTSGLWNADELKKIEGIKDGLRVVANNRPTLGGSGTPVKPEDIAINLVSRHSAFMARQLTRILTGSKGAQFFTDPQIYERMSKIARTTSGSPTNLVARASLMDYLNSDYTEDSDDQ